MRLPLLAYTGPPLAKPVPPAGGLHSRSHGGAAAAAAAACA